MSENDDLPFKIGQQIEAKSTITGYRGAWFRCKIADIGWRLGRLSYALKYFDFPDEKLDWIKVYEMIKGERKLQLMVRPCFPPCLTSEVADVNNLSEVTVVVKDTWKLGDLVDWFKDGCYWSGKITRFLGLDKVQISLFEPPLGEGLIEDAFCKDLRPSLNWSPQAGWTVPHSQDENDAPTFCAQILYPSTDDNATLPIDQDSSTTDDAKKITVVAHEGESPIASCSEPNHLDPEDPLGVETKRLDNVTDKVEKPPVPNESMDACPNDCKARPKRARPWAKEDLDLFFQPDTIETSILALEEIANKIRWIKDQLSRGFKGPYVAKPSWKFIDKDPFCKMRDT